MEAGKLHKLWSVVRKKRQNSKGCHPWRCASVCVCVRAMCLGTIHYTIRGNRRIWSVRVCVWMRSLCMKQNYSPISAHKWRHKQPDAHEFPWKLQTNSAFEQRPHPVRKERKIETEKQNQEYNAESESADESSSETRWDCVAECASAHSSYGVFQWDTWGKKQKTK